MILASNTAFSQRDCVASAAWGRKLLEAYPSAAAARMADLSGGALCTHPDQARKVVAELLKEPPRGYVSPYILAAGFAMGEDADNAAAQLEKSAELREPALMQLKVDRAFDAVRGDPRLTALEHRIGLLP